MLSTFFNLPTRGEVAGAVFDEGRLLAEALWVVVAEGAARVEAAAGGEA
jgi:hypothetical protein